MGSKHRLLPWIHKVLSELDFDTAMDAFSGSGCVAHLLKAMGKSVVANDFLRFAYHLAHGLTVNPGVQLSHADLDGLLQDKHGTEGFIERTFNDIFFTSEDLRFLDNTWANLRRIRDPYKQSLVISAMCRAAIKKQPRGVFTVARPRAQRYDDGRRDTQLSLRDHFLESVELFNSLVYDDGRIHTALCRDVFNAPTDVDLVYLDPPYVPRSDDNCYIKRYHFIEGLACYWRGVEILPDSKVKKIRKKFTPFSYRRTAVEAFAALFARFRESILVLSYSSNGYPDLSELVRLMKRYKQRVTVHEHEHRYHFGTHDAVRQERAVVQEYLLVGE
jgi:DNA adenine methylase/adenine-specific DNA-methyltransferase